MKPAEVTILVDTSNVPNWRRLGILICFGISAGAGLVWTLEQRLNSVPGTLEAKKTVVTTNRAVLVQNIAVKPGQTVVPGQPLCQLIDAQLEDRLSGKRREIAECEAEITRASAAADVEIAWRKRQLQAEIFETQLKVAGLSQERLNKQVEELAWKERLSTPEAFVIPTGMRRDDRRFAAILREDAAAAATEALATQIALCEQRLKNLETLERNLESRIRASSGVDVAEAKLQRSKQELAAIEGQVNELAMICSTHGTIGDIHFQAGDRLPCGGTVVEILDDQRPHVAVQIPSNSVSKIRQGTKVTVIFPMNEQRTGIVSSLAPQTVPVAGQSESVLPVRIEPTGKLWPKIAIGSNVKVQLH